MFEVVVAGKSLELDMKYMKLVYGVITNRVWQIT